MLVGGSRGDGINGKRMMLPVYLHVTGREMTERKMFSISWFCVSVKVDRGNI